MPEGTTDLQSLLRSPDVPTCHSEERERRRNLNADDGRHRNGELKTRAHPITGQSQILRFAQIDTHFAVPQGGYTLKRLAQAMMVPFPRAQTWQTSSGPMDCRGEWAWRRIRFLGNG